MRINFENLFGILLFVFCIYLFIRLRPYLDRLFEDLGNGYHYPYSPLSRIAVIGLVCLTIVAVAKIISRR